MPASTQTDRTHGVHGLGKVRAQLTGFLTGEVRGRTLLVGSPQGLGKTSLLNDVIAEVGAARADRALLRVDLHGPTLFADPDGKAFLTAIFKALHLAIVQRTADALVARNLPDLAESLRVAMLQGDADRPRLERLWKDAGALGDGASAGLFGLVKGRARQEVTAVWLVARAYMALSGAYDEKKKALDAREEATKGEARSPTAEWVGPAITLATGGAVGAELFPEHPAWAAATALLSLAVGSVSVTWTRSRTRTQSRELEFVETLDASALDRWLPVVIRQLKDVGLYPLFVVDELTTPAWTPPTDAFLARLNDCRAVVNHGATFCLMVDRPTWLTLDAHDATLGGAVTDRTFLVARPDELTTPDGTGQVRAAAVFRARARPIAVASAARGLTLRPAVDAEVRWQAAIEGTLEAAGPLPPLDHALAIELLYGLAEGWVQGAAVADNSPAALTAWARQARWIPLDADLAPRFVHLRRHCALALRDVGIAEVVGDWVHWTVTPQGRPRADWFGSPGEAADWIGAVDTTVRRLLGVALDDLTVLRGLAPLRPALDTWRRTPTDAATLALANPLSSAAETVQGAIVALWLLRWAISPALTPPIRPVLRRLAAHETTQGRGWTFADTVQLLRAYPFSGPLPVWPPVPTAWTHEAEALAARWSAQPVDAAAWQASEAAAARQDWDARLLALAETGDPPPRDARDLVWSVLDNDLAAARNLPLHAPTASAWSHHVFQAPHESPWARGAIWAALGFGEWITLPNTLHRPIRVRTLRNTILLHSEAEAGETLPASWPLPRTPQDPRVLVVDDPYAYFASLRPLTFDWLLYDLDADYDPSWIRHAHAQPRRFSFTHAAVIGPARSAEDLARIEATTGLPYVEAAPTAAETLVRLQARLPPA